MSKIVLVSIMLSGFLFSSENSFNSCKEILDNGFSKGDGVYNIKTKNNKELDVYCNMTKDGGGWLDVYRTFKEVDNSKTYRNMFFLEDNIISLPIVNDKGFFIKYGGLLSHSTEIFLNPRKMSNFKEIQMDWVIQGTNDKNECNIKTSWIPLNGPGWNGNHTKYLAKCPDSYKCIQGKATKDRDEPVYASYINDNIQDDILFTWSGSVTGYLSENCAKSNLIPINEPVLWFSKLLLR